MRSAPQDLSPAELERALSTQWAVRIKEIDYVPEGGGSHHWKVLDDASRFHFVTIDDLDDKDWMADTQMTVFEGLTDALRTSLALREEAGLDFVLAPVPASDGAVVHRLTDRYAISLFPYLAGRSFPFGEYTDPTLRHRALEMILAVHQATAVVRDIAPAHSLRVSGRSDLDRFLIAPSDRWAGGPFSDAAHQQLRPHAQQLRELVDRFDGLVARTAAARRVTVITHGEPHQANLMTLGEQTILIDWDTAALAPPERDLWMITTDNDDLARYEQATGHALDRDVLTLYRARWYLDDLASAVAMFRNDHAKTADTQRWFEELRPRLRLLPGWIATLS